MTKLYNVLKASAVLLVLMFSQFSAAKDIKANQLIPLLDGQAFSQIMIVRGEEADTSVRVIYFPEGESLEEWSRQISYGYVNNAEVKAPTEMAASLIKNLQAVNPGAKYQASASEDGSVILLDFIVAPRSAGFLELNAYRIQQVNGRLYNMHIIARFPTVGEATKETLAPVIDLRKQALAYMVKRDMTDVVTLLDGIASKAAE